VSEGYMKGSPTQRRRDFLKLASVPFIVPSSVFGENAPSNRINVAMLGVGRQGLNPNLTQFLRSPDAQVVAVCDVDAARLKHAQVKANAYYSEKTGSEYSGVRAYTDFREALARDDVDAVMISTPDHWHAPMGVLAARAGKHVCIEKPLTTCIAHGRALCEAVKEAEVVSRTDSEFRGKQRFWRMAELVHNGRIGKVQRIVTGVPPASAAVPTQKTTPVPDGLDYDLWLGPAFPAPYTEKRVHPVKGYGRPGWMRIEDYCNGMITNWGTHMNDISQWVTGRERTGPVSVKGSGSFSEGLWNTITDFKIEYEFADGVHQSYEIGRAFVRVEGTDGWLEAQEGKALTASSEELLHSKLEPDEVSFSETLEDKVDFLRAIKEGRETLEPVEVGHRTVSLCQLGLIACKLGRPLKWDPAAERFQDDSAANAMLSVPIRDPWGI